MQNIRIHDKEFEPYLSAAEIAGKVEQMANAINNDYTGRKPLFIAILNGSFIFASDLFKNISIEA